MSFLTITRSSPSPNRTTYSQPTLTELEKRVYVTAGDFTYSSGGGGGSPSSSNGLSIGAIVGIVLGGLVFSFLLILLLRKWPKVRDRLQATRKSTSNGNL